MNHSKKQYVFLYTLFSSLGDFIIMGDVIKKTLEISPDIRCFVAHRNNPFVKNWKYADPANYLFNVCRPFGFLTLLKKLRKAKHDGFSVFGLQQAPGSLQGFFFLRCLKWLGALDFTVDFNLYNADIVTRPQGHYILDLHLNQIKEILQIDRPENIYNLELPFDYPKEKLNFTSGTKITIGIHPFSRRGHLKNFVWTKEKWKEIIHFLLENQKNQVVIFGRDKEFDNLKEFFLKDMNEGFKKSLHFNACRSIHELAQIIHHLDILMSVNTSVVHIGHALKKKMVILCGPTFDFWIPKGRGIEIVRDKEATLSGSDKLILDERFPSISRIEVKDVLDAIKRII